VCAQYVHMRTYPTLAIVLLAVTGCAAEADESQAGPPSEDDFTAALADADRSELKSWTGAWVAIRKVSETGTETLRDPVKVTFADDAPAPVEDMRPFRSVLKILHAANYSYRDRAPFMRIGEKKDCSSVPQGGLTSVYICHKTTFDGRVLVHRVSMREYKAGWVPAGPEEVGEQRLFFTGNVDASGKDTLSYTYEINGERAEAIVFTRDTPEK
jgi:hypothetical protein